MPSSLPPLLWKPILVVCAETSLEISELRAGAPLLNCCRYSGHGELALWRPRWWLTCSAASLQPGHVECDFFHFASVNIMNLMPWAAPTNGNGMSASGYKQTFRQVRQRVRFTPESRHPNEQERVALKKRTFDVRFAPESGRNWGRFALTTPVSPRLLHGLAPPG